MFAILAILCFLLVVFHTTVGGIDLLALGLAFLACAVLLGPWPLGPWAVGSRRQV